jgi:hypothetical protein
MLHFFPLSTYNPLYNTNDLNLISVPTVNTVTGSQGREKSEQKLSNEYQNYLLNSFGLELF